VEFFFGFYLGILSIIILINIHWYFITKEKSYIYYAAFKIFLVVAILQAAKIIATNPFLLTLSTTIVLILALLFSKQFLDLKKNDKHSNRLLNAGVIGLLLLFAISFSTGNYSLFELPWSLLLSPLLVVGYISYKRGFEPAKYYVIGWGLSFLLGGLGDLSKFNVVSFYPNIPFSSLGHIIESIILSYAIFVKTTLLLKEKEEQSKVLIHQSKFATIGQMLENISHQWRQPLNRVSAFMINMQMYIAEHYDKDEYLINKLDQSQLQLETMSNTINDFTGFYSQDREKEGFVISSVINQVRSIIGESLEKNNISFEINIKDDFSLHSYPNELAQVILNLVQNAQDELVKRKIEEPIIQINIDTNKISVEDNAGGVKADIADEIFEPYVTTKSKTSSLGLGLYMSKLILEKHFNANIKLIQKDQSTLFNIAFD
jgi:signal transduction histidine kinase